MLLESQGRKAFYPANTCDPNSNARQQKEEARSQLIRVPQKFKDLYWNGRADQYVTATQEWDGGHYNKVITRLAPAVQAEIDRWKALHAKNNLEKIEKIKSNPGKPFRIDDDVLKIVTAKVKKKLGGFDDYTTIYEVYEALEKLGFTPPSMRCVSSYATDVHGYGQWLARVSVDKLISIHGKDKGHEGISRCERSMRLCQQEWYKVNFSNPNATDCLWANPMRIFWVTLTTDQDMDNTNYPKRVREVFDYLNRRIYKGKYKGITGIAVVEWKNFVRHVHVKLIIPPDATGDLPISDKDILDWNQIIFTKWAKVVAKERTRFGGQIRAVELAQDGQILKGSLADIYRTVDYQCKTDLQDAERKIIKISKSLLQKASNALTKYKNDFEIVEESVKSNYDLYGLLDSLDPTIIISDEEMKALSVWLPFAADEERTQANSYFAAIGRIDMINTNTLDDCKPLRPAYSKQWLKYNPKVFENYRHCKEEIVSHDVGRHVKSECCKAINKTLSDRKSKIRISPKPFQQDMAFCFLPQRKFQVCVSKAKTSKRKADMLIALGQADLIMRKFATLIAGLMLIRARPRVVDVRITDQLPMASGWS